MKGNSDLGRAVRKPEVHSLLSNVHGSSVVSEVRISR